MNINPFKERGSALVTIVHVIGHHRHPSVPKGYGSVLVGVLGQRRVWLCSPMRERHCLPHLLQQKLVSGCLTVWVFLLIRFSSYRRRIESSNSGRARPVNCLQVERSEAEISQFARFTSRSFKSLLQTSLKRSCGLPVGRVPCASSPYRRSFGMRPSSIRTT